MKNLFVKFSPVIALAMLAIFVGGIYWGIQDTIKQKADNSAHVQISMAMPNGNMGICSGTMISDTEVLTAAHCVQSLAKDGPVVQFEDTIDPYKDGKPLPIVKTAIEWVDPVGDVAMLKLPAPIGLSTLQLDCNAAELNEPLKFYGTPLGVPNVITHGYVAAPISGDLQAVDATILPGMSGGSAVDNDGHIVGINDEVMTYMYGVTGLGFIVPSPTICKDIDAHRAH